MRTLCAAFVIMTALAGSAQAEDWRFAGTSVHGVYGYDYESLEGFGSVTAATTTTVFYHSIDNGVYSADYTVESHKIDCEQRQIQTVSRRNYAMSGHLLWTSEPDVLETSMTPVTPGSSEAMLIEAICRNTGLPQGISTARDFAVLMRDSGDDL